MSKYFFHIRRDGTLIEDPEGSDLSDLDAAEREAIAVARAIMAERIKRGEAVHGSSFQIADEHGRELVTIRFRDLVTLH